MILELLNRRTTHNSLPILLCFITTSYSINTPRGSQPLWNCMQNRICMYVRLPTAGFHDILLIYKQTQDPPKD